MQEKLDSHEKKEMKNPQGNFFEAPWILKSDFKGASGIKLEGIIEEKETIEDPALIERKEPKKSDFKALEELEIGYTEKSWAKTEEKTGGKEAGTEASSQERTEPKESDFKVPGELETGYAEKSWAKPEKSIEGKTTERTEEVKQEAVKEARDREAREAREREERRTLYTIKKRLTKSKTDRKLLGVCGGLGEYFGIDPTFVRLAFVLLTLFNGIGLVLYIALAIIMPSGKNVEMIPSRK